MYVNKLRKRKNEQEKNVYYEIYLWNLDFTYRKQF